MLHEMCPPTATPTPNPPPQGGGEHTECVEVPAADPPLVAQAAASPRAHSFARRAGAAILGRTGTPSASLRRMARIAIIALLLLATAPALRRAGATGRVATASHRAAGGCRCAAATRGCCAGGAERGARRRRLHAAPSDADLRESVCLMIEASARAQQPAARILRAGDLAGEPVPARRGRPAHAQRRARPGHRPVHAAHRGRARPARSVRSGAGAAEIGRVPARARRPVRQSRAGGGGLQCRPAAGARLAFGPAHAAGGDAQLRAGHHRALGRRVGEERQARAGAAGAAELHAADGAAAPRAQSVRAEARGAGEPGRRQPVGRAAQPPGSRATMRWRTTRCWPSAMPRC